ncbi:MAG TPA: serine protease [Nitrososphaeraceae archaeon]
MINADKFNVVKDATVAIGLANKDTKDVISSFGTGFFIGGEYIVTSAHIFNQCIKYNAQYKEKNNGMEGIYSAFNITTKDNQLELNTYHIIKAIRLPPVKEVKGFTGSVDLDIGIGKLDCHSDNFLNIKKPTQLKLYDEIVICGYPSGRISLVLYRNKHEDGMGIQLRPIIQYGRVAGLMPDDDSNNPWGIQTDIIAMGGSSGSPIIDPSSGEVIGMAQQVIATMTTVDKEGMPSNLYELTKGPLYGIAPIGLAFGVTNQILSPLLNISKNYFENGLPPDFLFENTGVIGLF